MFDWPLVLPPPCLVKPLPPLLPLLSPPPPLLPLPLPPLPPTGNIPHCSSLTFALTATSPTIPG